MAQVYEVLGKTAKAGALREAAARLYERFNDAFWWEREGTYVLALDGRKRQVRSVASNAGHCLLERDRPARSRAARAGSAPCRGHVVRLGHPDALGRAPVLQPVQLPHGLRLAARQRHDRGRVPPLRLRRGSEPGGPGHLRGGGPVPDASPAGAVLRAATRRRRIPGAVPRRQRAAGVGRRFDLPLRRGAVRDPRSRLAGGRARAVREPGAASVAARAHHHPPPGRPRRDGPAIPGRDRGRAPELDRLSRRPGAGSATRAAIAAAPQDGRGAR